MRVRLITITHGQYGEAFTIGTRYMHMGGVEMSRLTLIGLVAFMGLGVGACHSGGQPGQDMPPDPMGGDPMNPMYRVPSAPAKSPVAQACHELFSTARCAPVESR